MCLQKGWATVTATPEDDAEAIGRLISLVLRVRSRLPSQKRVDAVIDQLAGIGGASSLG